LLLQPPTSIALLAPPTSLTKFCSSVADIPSLVNPDNFLEPSLSPEKPTSQPSNVIKLVEPEPPAEPPDATKSSDADLRPTNDPADLRLFGLRMGWYMCIITLFSI
jgi:hypothetical protein